MLYCGLFCSRRVCSFLHHSKQIPLLKKTKSIAYDSDQQPTLTKRFFIALPGQSNSSSSRTSILVPWNYVADARG